MYLTHSVWIWICIGILLILSEFAVPGLVVCFFGASALVVAALLFFFPGLTLAWQLFICGVLGVVLLLICRKFMPGVFLGKKEGNENDIDLDDVVGADCVCIIPIDPQTPGKVDFRGSHWNAVSEEAVEVGDLCTVVSRNNLTLTIKRK